MHAKWQTSSVCITETRYAQKELLAVVFAGTKFKDYVYGKHTIVETDHQPLITILRKPIHVALPISRECFSGFRATTSAWCTKRANTCISRAPNSQVSQGHAENNYFEVMSVSYISTARLEELRKHTAEDELLQTLCQPEKASSSLLLVSSSLTETNSQWKTGSSTRPQGSLCTENTLTLCTKATRALKRPSAELEA